jgi:hypothetical protein
MSFLAANPADCHHLSPWLVERAIAGIPSRNDRGELILPAADMPTRITLRLRRTSVANVQMKALLWRVSAVMYPVFCSVTASGPFRRPAALGLLLRVARPFGVSAPPKTSLQTNGKERRANFFRAPPRKQPFGTWEPGPLARLRPV